MNKGGFVYILASAPYGTLYIGVTADLARRVWEHRNGLGSKFCQDYRVFRLVYEIHFGDIEAAIRHEKRLKKYPRRWKINLIEEGNPTWADTLPEIAVAV